MTTFFIDPGAGGNDADDGRPVSDAVGRLDVAVGNKTVLVADSLSIIVRHLLFDDRREPDGIRDDPGEADPTESAGAVDGAVGNVRIIVRR